MEQLPKNADAQLEREPVPETFPIVEREQPAWREIDDAEELQENKILFYQVCGLGGETFKEFKLLRTIDGHRYVFRCSQTPFGHYGFDFKTIDHEYALTELTVEGRRELGNTVRSFVTTVTDSGLVTIDRLNVSPANQSYTTTEVDACRAVILKLLNNEKSERELTEELAPHEVLDYYRELTGEHFEGHNFRKDSKAKQRAAAFQRYLNSYLPDWKVDTSIRYPGNDFQLIPRGEDEK